MLTSIEIFLILFFCFGICLIMYYWISANMKENKEFYKRCYKKDISNFRSFIVTIKPPLEITVLLIAVFLFIYSALFVFKLLI